MSDTVSRELAAERWQKLHALLRQHGILRVEELAAALAVSPATVRRDLAALEADGTIRRVHGGAMPAASRDDEPLFDDKTALAAQEKQRIAQAALALVRPRDIIYLDGGSTVLLLARLLLDHTRLTVVTNSLRVAHILSNGGPRMILTGGECRRLSQTFVGPLARGVLEQTHIDTAFMGTIGISAADGATTTDPDEAFTKETAMRQAARRVLLADSTKFGKTSFIRFGTAAAFHTLITDKQMPRAERAAFRRAGIETLLV